MDGVPKHILVGNFGNQSIALLQWAIVSGLSNSYFVSIDTDWAGKGWDRRVAKGQGYARAHQVKPIQLTPPIYFTDLVRQRGEFPSQQFKWCASLLKGSTLNDWLDEIDPNCQAVILLAKQKATSSRYNDLTEFIEESEYYGGRKVWYPLIEHTLAQRNALIAQTPFELISTRSLECEPCIYTAAEELGEVHPDDMNKLHTLEQQIGQSMCASNCSARSLETNSVKDKMISPQSKEINFLKAIAMGCGSPWGCGE